jgi:PHS family inorganic phosphate transporter-like MFS transporter
MTEIDANQALSDLDNAKTSRFHAKTIITAGMGFFTDAYDLFAISAAAPAIFALYAIGNNSVMQGITVAAALFGAFAGAIIFGFISDKIGRKKVYGLELLIMVIFAVISAFSLNLNMLIISRFLLGIGVGGDYPISSTLMSEYANVKNRGKMVSMVFAMQGFGLLLAAVVSLVSIVYLPTNIAWRVMLGFGAVPAASVIYLRRKILETPRYSIQTKGDNTAAGMAISKATGKSVNIEKSTTVRKEQNRRNIISKYIPLLIGTAASWFLLDMVFYGTTINNGLIFAKLGLASTVDIRTAVYNTAVGNTIIALGFEIPGYWIAVALIDRAGRKTLQWIGFGVMAIAYLTLAIDLVGIEADTVLLFGLYGVSFLFANIGPNTTTFILPTELFPTQIRTTAHGISAGLAKFGAGVFTFLIPIIVGDPFLGKDGLLYMMGVIAVLGVLITLVFIKETKHKSLEETSRQAMANELS